MKAEYISHMGSDTTVVNAARVSFDKEVEQFDEKKDARLITYLAVHNHWTPFSHPQITLRYTVPIFVARQEFKHIIGFTRNELSRRYVDEVPDFYIPKSWRSRPEGSVKQGSGGDMESQNEWECKYIQGFMQMLELYKTMIAKGIAPEQARMVLPQSMYTSYYVTGSLSAFARMYKQRINSDAQVEIQELAKHVGEIIEPLFPVSWAALTE
jgi:thymidylate synthase (FAD)